MMSSMFKRASALGQDKLSFEAPARQRAIPPHSREHVSCGATNPEHRDESRPLQRVYWP